VTVGTFTAGAKSYAKSKPNIKLIDGDKLIELLLEHYEEIDPRYKSLVPLKRVYLPRPDVEFLSGGCTLALHRHSSRDRIPLYL
jgi:hypothetical protein